jgi:hypothetical protein
MIGRYSLISRSHMDWSAEEIARLQHMRAAGKTFSFIAARLGCTKSAAIAKWHRVNAEAK